MNKTFGIIGGDRRQAELARLLEADGMTVHTYGLKQWKAAGEGTLERVASAEVIILPLPLCKGDGVLNCEDGTLPTLNLFRYLEPDQKVLAGQVKPQQMQEAALNGIKLHDYFQREEVTIANAAITAEAAVQVAMENLDRTLLGMECLVTGFGRIGKLLSNRLHGLGARVSVAARKPESLAWIRAYGWNAIANSEMDGKLGGFSLVFNTVPDLILNERLLTQLPKQCLCIDLASKQGIDPAAADRLGLPNIWARSLPGRLAPSSAAAVIRDAVYYILLEG